MLPGPFLLMHPNLQLTPLTADVEEHERLDVQHTMFRAKVGSLVVPRQQIRRVLRPRTMPNGDKYVPQVLDIGTGSGRWVVEMAKDYPHCQFVGMDLAPANLSIEAPENCRFECDDANLGLAHYKNTFDVIHIRCVPSLPFYTFADGANRCASGGIRDWNMMLKEMEAALKPGGVLLTFGAGSLTMYDEFFEEITDVTEDGHENDPGRKFTWMNRVCHAMRTSMFVSTLHTRGSSGPDEEIGTKSRDIRSSCAYRPMAP